MSQVTISDEEYSQMLEVRLAAKHGFEAGEVTYEEYMAARAVVRRARKVRRTEGAVVENYRQQSLPQHNAMTKKAVQDEPAAPVALVKPVERRTKAEVTPEPEPAKAEEPKAPAKRTRTRKTAAA